MDELRKLLDRVLTAELEQIILSNAADKEKGFKIKVRPVLLKGELFFQETLFRGAQVFHKNRSSQEMTARLCEYLNGWFRQAQIKSGNLEASVLVSRKGKLTIKTHTLAQGKRSDTGRAHLKETDRGSADASDISEKFLSEEEKKVLSHNRVKHYILEEGRPVDFLVELGVQTPDGRVTKARYDKFRQINRYLEFIEDVLDELPKERTIHIIDFGCGKSYLTFAMYYYLHELQHLDVRITGLDLKEDVIGRCSRLAVDCGYEGLHFEKGDIGDYEQTEKVDMVVSLHACDTATDYALAKAVGWGAKVIMAVPCCQHEVNRQIRNEILAPVLKYGLIKERMSALFTDAIRAGLLEQQGYETQVLEFIDMEHTPKNLLIRAVKRNRIRPAEKGRLQDTMDFLHVTPALAGLLKGPEPSGGC